MRYTIWIGNTRFDSIHAPRAIRLVQSAAIGCTQDSATRVHLSRRSSAAHLKRCEILDQSRYLSNHSILW
jgi:hypothetical protein